MIMGIPFNIECLAVDVSHGDKRDGFCIHQRTLMMPIPTVSYGWTPWKIYFRILTRFRRAKDSVRRRIEPKGWPAQRVGRLWQCKLSEIDVCVNAGGADRDTVDQGKEND
jgi:hypothetical protein